MYPYFAIGPLSISISLICDLWGFAFSWTRREPIPPRPSVAAVGLERKAPPNVSPSGVAKGRYMVLRLGGLLDERASGIRVRGTARRLTPNTSWLRQTPSPESASDRVTNPQPPISVRQGGQIVGTHDALGIGRRQPGAGN